MLRANANRALRAVQTPPTQAALIPHAAAIQSQELRDFHPHWKFFLLEGMLVLVLGLLAVAWPNVPTLGIEQLVGWLLIVGGFIGTASIIRKHHRPASWWLLPSSVILMALGVLLVRSPVQGVITLTIVMVVLFVIKGLATIFMALDFRPDPRNRLWSLCGGLVTLMFAYLMWQGWPNTANWVIGLYVGINLIYLGACLIFTAIASRGIDTEAR
jgi:uncharacterized membrane protein HdeD (DUF308 family)